jgi:hypothetical protein
MGGTAAAGVMTGSSNAAAETEIMMGTTEEGSQAANIEMGIETVAGTE